MQHDNIMQVLLTSEIYNNSIIEKDDDNNTLFSLTSRNYLLIFGCWEVKPLALNVENKHWDKDFSAKIKRATH